MEKLWGKIKTKSGKIKILTECINCGLDDKRHIAKGLCGSCYFYKYNKTKKRILSRKRWYMKWYPQWYARTCKNNKTLQR